MAHIWGFRSDEEKRRKQYRDKKCTSSSRLLSRFWPKYTYTLYHARSVSLYLGNFLGFCDQRWKEGLARLLGHLESNSWLVYRIPVRQYIHTERKTKKTREIERWKWNPYIRIRSWMRRVNGKRVRESVFMFFCRNFEIQLFPAISDSVWFVVSAVSGKQLFCSSLALDTDSHFLMIDKITADTIFINQHFPVGCFSVPVVRSVIWYQRWISLESNFFFSCKDQFQ